MIVPPDLLGNTWLEAFAFFYFIFAIIMSIKTRRNIYWVPLLLYGIITRISFLCMFSIPFYPLLSILLMILSGAITILITTRQWLFISPKISLVTICKHPRFYLTIVLLLIFFIITYSTPTDVWRLKTIVTGFLMGVLIRIMQQELKRKRIK